MCVFSRQHFTEVIDSYFLITGIPELREAICNFHLRYDKLSGLHPDQIVVGPGSKELIFLLLSVFKGGK